jgi:cobyrinic acid a,c-diamide synthase
MACKTLLIAGTHSGVGKTTVAIALMAALRRRGLVVQPFKVGPDFIDAGHHTSVCGRTCRNLDTWLLTEDYVRSTFNRASAGSDVAIIEGVMGLFDGGSSAGASAGGARSDGISSSADIAKLLDVPVVLVVDASAMAASVAAIVKGYAEFDPAVRLAGVICNRVAGPRHHDYLEPAIRKHTGVVPLGWVPRNDDWVIPERHLGLMTSEDCRITPTRAEAMGRTLEETVDVDRILEIAGSSNPAAGLEQAPGIAAFPGECPPPLSSRRIAVARDAAFCFYYPDNLEILARAGGILDFFSPLSDSVVPDGAELLYLGGGYPEIHAAALADNLPMRRSIRRFHEQGRTIYAECGGLMYACRELVDASGRCFPMLDLLPARTVMQSRRAALGYVSLSTLRESPLGPAGTWARGHEFHYSRLEPLGPLVYGGELSDGLGSRGDGLLAGNLWAGYAHLHFGSNPAIARSLLAGR